MASETYTIGKPPAQQDQEQYTIGEPPQAQSTESYSIGAPPPQVAAQSPGPAPPPTDETPEARLERLAPAAGYVEYLKKEHPQAYEASKAPDEAPLFIPGSMGSTTVPTWNQVKKAILAPGGMFGPPTFEEWRHNELWKSKEGQDLIFSGIVNQLQQHPIQSALGVAGAVGGAGPTPEEGALPSKPPINLETLTQPTSSFGKGVASGASGLLSPANIGLMLTMPESKLMGAYYTGQMGKGSLDAIIAARDKFKAGDKEGAYQLLGQAAVSGVMTGVGGYFSLRGEGSQPAIDLQKQIADRRLALLNTLPPERQIALLQKAGLVPPDVSIEDMLPSLAKTSGGKLQIGADIGRLTSILGSSMYSNRGAPVVVKELLQNALDAVRPNNGKVEANIDQFNRTFTIKDSGVGMTPNDVYTVFTDIGASGKGEQAGASGGFGLAKIAPFMIPDKMTLRTIGANADGKWQTEFTSTPEDIVAGNVNPKITRVAADTPTGTWIQTTFPADKSGEYDKADFFHAEIFLKSFLGSSDIPGAGIRFTRGSGSAQIPLKPSGEPISNELFRVNGPGGEYVFSTGASKQRGDNYHPYEVHNNGLYQFTGSAYVPGAERAQLPTRTVVNIRPDVKEGHPDYPFSTSREQVTKQASDFVTKTITDRIIRPQIEEATNLIKAKYNSMPTLTLGDGTQMPIYDSGARLDPKELKFLQSQPVMKDIGAVINSVARNLQNLASKLPASMFQGSSTKRMGSTIDRFGILLADTIGEGGHGGNRVYGVYVPDPADPKNHATVFINPFGWAALAEEGFKAGGNIAEFPDEVDPDIYHNPDFAASQLYHTITHEIVHDAVKGHNESFTTALMNLDSFMGMNTKIGSLEDIANAFRSLDPTDPNGLRTDFGELLQVYRQSRGRPENEKDILGGESLATGPEQPEQEPKVAPVTDAQERGETVIRADSGPTRGGGHPEADQPGHPIESPTGGQGPQAPISNQQQLSDAALRQKLTQLISMIPSFPSVEGGVGGKTGTVTPPLKAESLDHGVGIGAVDSRPPVISETVDRDLANGGITVVRGGSDIGLLARYVGSLTQAARRLGNPIFSQVASRMVDTSIAISRNTADAIKGFRKEVRAKVSPAEWDQVVNLLNDPAVNSNNLPAAIAPDLRDAYNYTRELLDRHREAARDAKREELVNGGMTRTKAIQLVPDDWGIKEGYYVHAFPGNWTINEMTGVDARGNPIWEPITTSWRQITLSAAQAKASEYIATNPNSQLKVELDNISLPGRGISDRNRLQALHDEIKASSTFIHNGANPDGIMADLRDASSRLTFGPRRPSPRMFGPTLQREANLPGWVRDMDNFERYIVGMERYIQLAPARPAILKLRNAIAQMSGMPDVLKPGEIPKRYSGDYANTLGRLDASIEALEGYPTGFDAAVRNSLQKAGYDPNLLNNAYSSINSLEALLKLGFNPASAGLHLAQTIAATYPVLGERWTGYGILNAYSHQYDALVHDLGIEATSNLMDIDTFQAYRGGYLSNISGPIMAAKAGFAALRDTGLFMFSKGVETARRISAIGAYEKAISEGMQPDVARNIARDTLIRTQFLYSPVDAPMILRNIPRPMGQFKNFTLKMMEFTLGLRGAEIPRFLVGMGIIGYSGFPMLSAISNLSKWLTNYDPDNEFKRAFPRFSRGALGYLGIDYTKNIGFSDWLGSRSMEPSSLLGPGGSDVESIIKAAASLAKGPSREGEQARSEALRNISPEARRIWDEGMRMATKPTLSDPRTGSVIVKQLTPIERTELLLGLTPLRVAEERESHEYIRNQIETMKDKRGYFVDRLAEMEVSLSNPSLSENDRADYVKEIVKTAKMASDYGVGQNLAKAVRERAREMTIERLQRDVKKAPKAERYPAYQEMQRFNAESSPEE
jgi:hypothetical protein